MKTRVLLVSILLLSFFGVFIWHKNNYGVIPIWRVPKLLSAMRAKEFCSCHFMLDNTLEYCLARVEKGYPILKFDIDKKNRVVSFSNYLSSSTAWVKSERLGCALE